MPNMFYTRTQSYVRGAIGTIAACTYKDLIPEEDAFNYDGKVEQYYIVRFRQKDLWEEYPFDNDTLQTELPDMARARLKPRESKKIEKTEDREGPNEHRTHARRR